MTLTADGIATRNVRALKTTAETSPSEVKRWCPQTMKLMPAMARVEKATARYPKMALREWTAISSLMIAMPGRIMTYTTGWE